MISDKDNCIKFTNHIDAFYRLKNEINIAERIYILYRVKS